MSNSIAPGSSADVNVKVTALTTNQNVPVTYKTIILKKNLVNGVNTLTQEMMSATNTKYVVKYDFTLGEDITVPIGCILEFDGGSISASGSNDTIIGSYTGIIGDFNFNSTTIAGTWSNSTIVATQLKGGSDNKTFNTTYLQKLIGVFGEVVIPDGEWYIGIISIDSTSKCNVFKGISRKGTILHADSIYVGKNAVDEVPISLSPRVESFTLISNTNGSGIGLEVWGYNMILRDLYIKGFEYGIKKSRDNGELITSQIEKVVIFKCVYGIYLVTSSEQTANIYSINANIIKDCFIVDCLTCGIKVMGTSNIIRDSALQGSPTNIIITGISDNSSTSVFDYNTAVINCYFEAKVEGNTVTGVDIDIQNVNDTYIYGLTIKNNYHSTVVAGQSRYYDVVKFALLPINYPELLNNCDIDRYRKKGVYYPMSLIFGVNTEDNITTIDGNKYITYDGSFGRVNLEIGRTYRVYIIARKTEGNLGTNVVMLIRNVATTSQMHYINYAVDALNQDKVGYVDITPTTSKLYEIFQNASQPYLVRELIIKDITLDVQ